MKDHEIALLVNELVSVCEMFHGSQQLRQQISSVVGKAVKGTVPDGQREQLNALIKDANQQLTEFAALKFRVNTLADEQQSQLKMIGAINKDLQRLMDRTFVAEARFDDELTQCCVAINDHHTRLTLLEEAPRANA